MATVPPASAGKTRPTGAVGAPDNEEKWAKFGLSQKTEKGAPESTPGGEKADDELFHQEQVCIVFEGLSPYQLHVSVSETTRKSSAMVEIDVLRYRAGPIWHLGWRFHVHIDQYVRHYRLPEGRMDGCKCI